MKGILLAGGHGTRLEPLTRGLSKQMLPVYDKPMIYYPLSMLMLSGIREILVISTPRDIPIFQGMLGDGCQWGLQFSYLVQEQPRGIADAFVLGKDFIGDESVGLILGDNIFYGHGLPQQLRGAAQLTKGALIFAYAVKDPSRYGVVEFDNNTGKALRIEEKPKLPRSRYAVPGIYFYDNRVVDIAANLAPSARGELEITDVNMTYLQAGELQVDVMGRGVAWLDAGTHESLLQASTFVQALQERQGMMISCPEEIAYRLGYIDEATLVAQASAMSKENPYSGYLLALVDELAQQA
ncbi:MAG: glucose-1-phosphate thymidylyltransferase RfbA [Caldilineaceae bacterium]